MPVFRLSDRSDLYPSVLHSFNGTDGGYIYDSPIQAADGNFYLTSLEGGGAAIGAIIRLTPSGTATTLYSFTEEKDGLFPIAPLVQGTDGNFYGTSEGASEGEGGPPENYGAVYKLSPSGTFTLLHYFCSTDFCADGYYPSSALVQGTDGSFYGTTTGGGLADGVVFKVTSSGTFSVVYTFCSLANCADGGLSSGLVQGIDGNFYGTTEIGGATGAGSVYKLTPAGELTTLYSFCPQGKSPCPDGSVPSAALVQGSDGNFYGTTATGGTGSGCPQAATVGCGTLFKMTPAGALTTLYNFCSQGGSNCTDGFDPIAALTAGSDGNFYGATFSGVNPSYCNGDGCGTLFRITPSGTLTTIYSFCSSGGSACTDGQQPYAGVIQSDTGVFYGTTTLGGASDLGTIYTVTTSPALAAPVQLSLSQSQIDPGSSATLSWKVLNAFSTTMQQCAAFVKNSTPGAGTWSGIQPGTYSSSTKLYSGSATITPTANGTYTYVLTCGGQESGFATLIVGYNSTTALTASPASPSVGQQVALSATVTGSQTTPTGSVTFSVDGVTLGSAKLNGSGVATFTASSNGIAPGSYPITANYSGDSTYSSSASKALTISLAKAPTSTSLAVSPNPVTPPASATLTATVSRSASGAKGTPTGSVTFSVDGVTLGSAKLNGSGIATLTASSAGIKPGSYPVVAKYSGDTSDSASTSAAVNVTVQ